MNLQEYRDWAAKSGAKAPRSRPELQLQITVAGWLTKWLRRDVYWGRPDGVLAGRCWRTLARAVRFVRDGPTSPSSAPTA